MPDLVLRASHVAKSFGARPVLRDVSLEAREGDVICILGGSGSGKSTFLRCLNLLELPDEGEIEIAGQRAPLGRDKRGRATITDRKALCALRSRSAMVFQNFNLWSHMTALENVMEAPVQVHGVPRAEAHDRARALLARVGMAGHERHYPMQMSGGQQQRVAIARALATDPRLILFDEPTSALDPERVREVLDLMRSLADEGCTMIIVTHEMAFARDVSTRIVHLRDGLVESSGSPVRMFGPDASEAFRAFLAH
ncbi:amino acid ABC transporter ATP-binding protein [Sphingobium sp. Sx8-8]|uniref:ATP-binding cassette domain-containing protein n=1 Tax=Sphingobium sp. Sx8-8 TaxID=2933617 RepID=UPI001FDAA112|nr:amino acid ABC transporter ATP-binding protein [Sphingobium sp. Sx8-8]